jgi:hypothetical protein
VEGAGVKDDDGDTGSVEAKGGVGDGDVNKVRVGDGDGGGVEAEASSDIEGGIATAQRRGRQCCRWHVQAALGFCVRVVTPFIPGILLVSADIAQSKPISDLW